MKTTHIYLILFLSLSTLNCCKDDDPTNKECVIYQVTVSDNCNCDNYLCESSYLLEKLEYERLVKIQNESSEDCVFVNGKGDALGSNEVVIIDFEGYLLRLVAIPLTPFC
ncbi:hypothetical protein [Lutibacter sp.]|uniref:hypothetical protein n=1 Tax=Lutibacter sp. TaxID=1925666 RepID=UPI003566794B